eukprot:1160010-Pelagomonas_calceolata.AAC.4
MAHPSQTTLLPLQLTSSLSMRCVNSSNTSIIAPFHLSTRKPGPRTVSTSLLAALQDWGSHLVDVRGNLEKPTPTIVYWLLLTALQDQGGCLANEVGVLRLVHAHLALFLTAQQDLGAHLVVEDWRLRWGRAHLAVLCTAQQDLGAHLVVEVWGLTLLLRFGGSDWGGPVAPSGMNENLTADSSGSFCAAASTAAMAACSRAG